MRGADPLHSAGSPGPVRWLWLLWLVLAGCVDFEEGPWPIEGSTYRISPPEPGARSELTVEIFARRRDCTDAPEVAATERDSCVPRVDRATGETHLSFILRDKATRIQPIYLPLEKEDIAVSHNGRQMVDADYELIPHGVMRAGQLFVLLIDGSGSMYEADTMKIDKVQRALLQREVVDGFFPGEGVDTAVVLMRFTDEVRGLDGGQPVVLRDRAAYRRMVEDHLVSSERGYTHLYDAIQHAVEPLLEQEELRKWLKIKDAEPTIIALTDGFNNEAPDDRCRTNAPRLQETLEAVLKARSSASFGVRPSLYTVGLGEALFEDFKPPKGGRIRVSESRLCGRYVGRRINGDLEREGIDNASLAWLAEVGGGRSYVARSHGGVAALFRQAAAERYVWYEVAYRTSWFHHRQPFDARIRLRSFAQAESTVHIQPGPWLDAPTGTAGPDGWAEPTPLRRTATLTMPLIGLFVVIAFLTPALFNARRAIFRRPRRS